MHPVCKFQCLTRLLEQSHLNFDTLYMGIIAVFSPHIPNMESHIWTEYSVCWEIAHISDFLDSKMRLPYETPFHICTWLVK
jgi:hypothetical protein